MKPAMASGCRTGPPSYLGWQTVTTTLRWFNPPVRDSELGLWIQDKSEEGKQRPRCLTKIMFYSKHFERLCMVFQPHGLKKLYSKETCLHAQAKYKDDILTLLFHTDRGPVRHRPFGVGKFQASGHRRYLIKFCYGKLHDRMHKNCYSY